MAASNLRHPNVDFFTIYFFKVKNIHFVYMDANWYM